VAQVTECLLCKCKALSSNSSLTKNKEKLKKKKYIYIYYIYEKKNYQNVYWIQNGYLEVFFKKNYSTSPTAALRPEIGRDRWSRQPWAASAACAWWREIVLGYMKEMLPPL
jgi:hypothetical protein